MGSQLGVALPPRGMWQSLDTFVFVMIWVGPALGIQWVGARDAATYNSVQGNKDSPSSKCQLC